MEFRLDSKAHIYKKESLRVLLTGVLTLAIFILYGYYSSDLELNKYSTTDYLLAFLFGATILSTYYFLRDTEFIGEVRKVPFIGFKLSLAALIIIFISGFPILYFLYKFLFAIYNSVKKSSNL